MSRASMASEPTWVGEVSVQPGHGPIRRRHGHSAGVETTSRWSHGAAAAAESIQFQAPGAKQLRHPKDSLRQTVLRRYAYLRSRSRTPLKPRIEDRSLRPCPVIV